MKPWQGALLYAASFLICAMLSASPLLSFVIASGYVLGANATAYLAKIARSME